MSMEPIPFLIFRKVLQYTIMLHWINYGFHDMSILDQVQPKFIYSSYGVRFPSGLSSCAAYSTVVIDSVDKLRSSGSERGEGRASAVQRSDAVHIVGRVVTWEPDNLMPAEAQVRTNNRGDLLSDRVKSIVLPVFLPAAKPRRSMDDVWLPFRPSVREDRVTGGS